jgi:hypothetical protein
MSLISLAWMSAEESYFNPTMKAAIPFQYESTNTITTRTKTTTAAAIVVPIRP